MWNADLQELQHKWSQQVTDQIWEVFGQHTKHQLMRRQIFLFVCFLDTAAFLLRNPFKCTYSCSLHFHLSITSKTTGWVVSRKIRHANTHDLFGQLSQYMHINTRVSTLQDNSDKFNISPIRSCQMMFADNLFHSTKIIVSVTCNSKAFAQKHNILLINAYIWRIPTLRT